MNDAQCEMLKKYVSHICIDGTHGTNGYDFELITLLILDDMRQGFPCSFFISNRTDYFVLEIFFAKIKEKVGEICPTVFMSDMAESFFNAWCNTFQSKPKHRLFCTWHVDRAWRKNLHKIQSREMRLEVYKTLRTLMEEKDVDTFNIMFNEVLKNFLENDMTREFCKYFIENYANCINSWPYCHHLQSGLNTNMHVESMHETLKYIYLKGRNAKRLNKTIYALMRFIRNKLVDRLIVMNKGKLTSKLKDLRQRHKTSLSLSTATITENESGYIVPSSSTHETYLIQENNTNCSLAQAENLNTNNLSYLQNDLLIDEDETKEADIIITELCKKNEKSLNALTLSEKKEQLKTKFLEILDSVSSEKELKIVENSIKSLTPTLSANVAMKENKFLVTENKCILAIKAVKPQKRLFSTRKRKRTAEHRIAKPSEEVTQKNCFIFNNE
ncbi:MULE domain-containing protein [Trichonephila clavipes]|nr:MULE domain-containing protein [Trichonephila clavipes]